MQQVMTITRRTAAFAKGFARDPLTHWPFTTISRRVYGNLSGFRQNVYGSIHSAYHRLTGHPTDATSLDPEACALVKELRHSGALKVNDWPDMQVVDRIRKKVLDLAKTSGYSHSDYMTLLEGQHLARNVPEIFEIFSPRVIAFLEGYFGSSFMVNSTAFRLTRHIPEEVRSRGEVYSDHWHTDSGPTSVMAMFVLLKDLSLDGGPTATLDIPATKEMVRKGYSSRIIEGPLIDAIEGNPSKSEMIGPAGTLMFVNVARCLHRAGIPASGRQREWLQFRLYPCSGSTDTSKLRPAKILEYTNGIKQDY